MCRDAEVFQAARDVRKLFCHAIGSQDGIIRIDAKDQMPDIQRDEFFKLVDRRIAREPVSHLIGTREFYGRNFEVNSAVLDPRPETELLVEIALSQPFECVLDLGAGTGCIALSLIAEARERQNETAWGYAVEKSKDAYALLQRNRERHGLEGAVVTLLGSWLEPLAKEDVTFDLIVSNPPYIAASEMESLQPEVRLFEPRIALTDEGDGLGAYREITQGLDPYLAPKGRVLLETGPTQAGAVSEMMRSAGLNEIEVHRDLDGRDRVVEGRKPA